jgi:hypothetical protein
LKITTDETANSTLRVCIGWVPPQSFSASQIAHIERITGRNDRIEIDGAVVWSRAKEITFQGQQDEENEANEFEDMAKEYGLLDENGIPS